ncbi:MAG: UDP-N-acetylglucosamine 2-epimerase [bacterium]|nr:UDP-N-acetylglucosamine 2-epimerase [bacterium]
MKKKICIITGSRAEYGLFYPLLKLLRNNRLFKLQLVVTGSHLSREFGLTYREIEQDGFTLSGKVDLKLDSDTPQGVLNSMGLALSGLGKVLTRLKPDAVVILGDRFEIFCAATAAYVNRIPVVHLYGGELSAGAIDEAFRHSITKMSFLHFTATEEYRRRVIQLGEEPKRIFMVGAIGLDNIKKMKLLTRTQLEESLDFSLGDQAVLVTFHPVTLETDSAGAQCAELLRALDQFPDLKIIFTRPNADTNGRVIIKLIEEYVRNNPGRAKSFSSLGQLRYLSSLKQVKAVVGNSSSGIIEAPSLKIPTVNIGDRQKGRIKAQSIIDCRPEEKDIVTALKKAFSPAFQARCRKTVNPYGQGYAADKIMRVLAALNWDKLDLKKSFYDLRGRSVQR